MDGAGVDATISNRCRRSWVTVMPHWHTHHKFRAARPHAPSSETRLEPGTRGPRRNRRDRTRGRRSSKESDGDARGPWARTERRRPTPRPTPACRPRHPVGERGRPWRDRHPFRSGGSTVPWRTGGRPPRQGLGRRSAAASLSAQRNDSRFSVIVKTSFPSSRRRPRTTSRWTRLRIPVGRTNRLQPAVRAERTRTGCCRSWAAARV